MNKKILLPVVFLLLGGAGAYMYTKPKPKVIPPKVAGTVYLLPQSFLCNLADGQYAKFSVALVLAKGQSDGATAESSPDTNSAGDVLGTLPEEAVIRNIITNVMTNDTSTQLITLKGRAHVQQVILQEINADTDVKTAQVLFPDLAIQ
jgi:flagellar basal body-associated protein FliL